MSWTCGPSSGAWKRFPCAFFYCLLFIVVGVDVVAVAIATPVPLVSSLGLLFFGGLRDGNPSANQHVFSENRKDPRAIDVESHNKQTQFIFVFLHSRQENKLRKVNSRNVRLAFKRDRP